MSRLLSAFSDAMLESSSIISINSSHNPHSNSSRLETDMSDYEALFDNDLNIEKADHLLLNKYVIYQLSQYSTLNVKDFDLWIVIQIDFQQFIEDNLKQLNKSI